MINKSAYVTDKKQISFIERELQPLGDNEVRVHIKACGVCGTDMHFYNTYQDTEPTPLGHEVAGVIVEVGENIHDVKVGSDVVVQNHVACGVCSNCAMRRVEHCSNIQTYMNDQAGLSSYLTVDRKMIIEFNGLDYASATLAEPLTVAMDLFQEADIKKEDSVLIMGPGVIGLFLTFLASHAGASSVSVVGHHLDTIRGLYRKEVATSFGAESVFDSSVSHWKQEIFQHYRQGFSKVIITSPPKTIPDGIELAGFGGYIVYDGISFSDDSITFGANDFHFKKKRLIASHAIPNFGFPYALELLKKYPILTSSLLTHRYSFNELTKAFEGYDSKDVKIIKTVIDL